MPQYNTKKYVEYKVLYSNVYKLIVNHFKYQYEIEMLFLIY